MLVSVNAANTGLSPLARGTHILQNTRLISTRFIPAGAGNTRRLISAARDSPVYPRWRGEHIDPEQQYAQTDGLSPLARGTLLCRFHITGLPRFIPAGAGNTTVQTAGYYFFAVYPRWRGEHNVRLSPLCVVAGLSPLARGTLHGFGFLFDGRRFIPAGAGNTYIRAKNKATATVYPRWRGEHPLPVIQLHCQCGLSPLARGTHACSIGSEKGARFIPAGAGNTPRLRQ